MKYSQVTQIPYAMEPGDMDEILDLVSAYGSASYADGYHSYRSDREEISVSREAFTALLEAISNLIATPTEAPAEPTKLPVAVIRRIDAAAEALSYVLAFTPLSDERQTQVSRALSGLRAIQATGYEAPAITVEAEPVGYVNGDELANMLGDRVATIQGKQSGWRKTPLYLAAHPKPAAQVDESANLHSSVVDETPEMHVPKPAAQSESKPVGQGFTAEESEAYWAAHTPPPATQDSDHAEGVLQREYCNEAATQVMSGKARHKRLIQTLKAHNAAMDESLRGATHQEEGPQPFGSGPEGTDSQAEVGGVRAAIVSPSQVGSEPVYQIRLPGDSESTWHDASEEAWHLTSAKNRRILATTQAPPVGVSDEQIHDIADDFKSQYMHGGTKFDEFDYFGFAKAIILALRGTEGKAT